MKQHQWTNPLLSMLASTAMCAILSLTQPVLPSVESTAENGQLAYQLNSIKAKQALVNKDRSQAVKRQLEIALTHELFTIEQSVSKMERKQRSSSHQEMINKQECGERSTRSVKKKYDRPKYTMPMLPNTYSI